MKNWDGVTPYDWACVKRDGIYVVVTRDRFGTVTTRSRLNNELDLKFVPSLKNAWLRLRMNEQCHGELYYPGRRASYVKSAIAQRDPALRFEVFKAGTCMTFQELDDWCVQAGFRTPPRYPMPERPDHATLEDCEGWVFADTPHDGVKWKPEPTVDLVCTGFKDGRGQHLGLVGSIEGSIGGRVVAMVGGMDLAERVRISEAEESYLGRVFEARYQYVGDGGRLRHPRFVRWRDDKTADQCTEDQLQ